MKKIIITALLLIPLVHANIKAQTGPNDIISKDNVSISIIKTVLENAFYEIQETESAYVKFKDVFSIYADLDKDNRYITLSVNWPINENFSLQDRFNLLNRIGKDVLVVTPYYNSTGTSIIVKTTIWIEGGMTARNFILSEKIFVKALNLILDKDELKIIK